MVTDYDCWYEAETGMTVTIDVVIENLNKNVATEREMIRRAVRSVPEKQECDCAKALANAIITEKSLWPKSTVDKLGLILRKYL